MQNISSFPRGLSHRLRKVCSRRDTLPSVVSPYGATLEPGAVPEYALALDMDRDGRVHAHGAIVVTPSTELTIRRALRQAAGRWEGPIGNRRQLILNGLDRPDWHAWYVLRSHDRLQHIVGSLLTWSRPTVSAAQRYWRTIANDVGRGYSLVPTFRPFCATFDFS